MCVCVTTRMLRKSITPVSHLFVTLLTHIYMHTHTLTHLHYLSSIAFPCSLCKFSVGLLFISLSLSLSFPSTVDYDHRALLEASGGHFAPFQNSSSAVPISESFLLRKMYCVRVGMTYSPVCAVLTLNVKAAFLQ